MKSRWHVFNFFLVLALAAAFSGCATEKQKKKREYSNLRIHVETDRSSDRSSGVSIHRAAPLMVNVEPEPILDEHFVTAAVLIDQPGGFAIQVKFDRRGSWILERTTVTSRGKHLAVYSYFGEGRWLAAPIVTGKNSTGLLTFTPDATREEAERIVRGLNNVARKLERRENWPFRDTIDR